MHAIKLLMKYKDDVDIDMNEFCETPLISILKNCSIEIQDKLVMVKFLIKNGDDVNYIYNDRTPLMHVIENDIYKEETISMAKLLISTGADVNYKAKDGTNPLLYAIMKNNKAMFSLLLNYGADANCIITDGMSLLFYLLFYRCDDLKDNYQDLKLLLDRMDPTLIANQLELIKKYLSDVCSKSKLDCKTDNFLVYHRNTESKLQTIMNNKNILLHLVKCMEEYLLNEYI